jgi:hypothetical protein
MSYGWHQTTCLRWGRGGNKRAASLLHLLRVVHAAATRLAPRGRSHRAIWQNTVGNAYTLHIDNRLLDFRQAPAVARAEQETFLGTENILR